MMRIGIGLGGLVVATALFGLSGCAGNDTTAAGSGSGAVTAEPAMATATDDPSESVVIVTHSRERKEIKLPYGTTTKKTATLAKGVTKVARQGRAGLRVKVFRLTLEDGVEVDRKLVIDVVKRKPVNRLVLKGTRVPQPAQPTRSCDPNYGGCVPIAYDVDCAGGSGDGPKYAQGPVKVIGSDIYDLDADGDGWGCD